MTEKRNTIPEVWALRIIDEPGPVQLMRALDCEGEPFLAFESERAAKQSAKYHANEYDIPCEPVRLL